MAENGLTFLQELIGLPELTVLALELLYTCLLGTGLAWSFAAITPGLPDPNTKTVWRTA